MKGYIWAASSVLLVSFAQMLMKWGVMQLPPLFSNHITLTLLEHNRTALLAVACGIAGYVFSMVCWFFTLRYLPLSVAYPIISISYVIVYFAAVMLPWFSEAATLLKTMGTLFILFGVWLITSSQRSCADDKNNG